MPCCYVEALKGSKGIEGPANITDQRGHLPRAVHVPQGLRNLWLLTQ